MCLATVLLTSGCNQAASESEAAEKESGVTLTSAAGGDCCAAGGCCKCAEAAKLVSSEQDQCGDCTACADGDSASCKCGETTEIVSTRKRRVAVNCTACSDGDSANCKCDETESVKRLPQRRKQTSQESIGRNGRPRKSAIFLTTGMCFIFCLANHEKITRQVTETANGVETLTESDDPEIVAKLQEHVASMYQRVENVQPIRMRDPLYREIFKHADQIHMDLEKTEKGIRVTETADDEYVVKLIQAHAKVVSGFAEHGFAEARKNHEPPQSP